MTLRGRCGDDDVGPMMLVGRADRATPLGRPAVMPRPLAGSSLWVRVRQKRTFMAPSVADRYFDATSQGFANSTPLPPPTSLSPHLVAKGGAQRRKDQPENGMEGSKHEWRHRSRRSRDAWNRGTNSRRSPPLGGPELPKLNKRRCRRRTDDQRPGL
jgi:hypothetical protein